MLPQGRCRCAHAGAPLQTMSKQLESILSRAPRATVGLDVVTTVPPTSAPEASRATAEASIAVELEDVHVAAHLAQPAKRDNAQGTGLERRG